MVIEAGELAKQKSLGIAAGTQRRHQQSYQETIKRIHDGAIGEIVYAKCYWNGGEIWVDRPRAGLERHGVAAPQLELLHLALRRPHRRAARPQPRRDELGPRRAPVRAVSALGGRQVRTGERHGHIFDHFAVEFEYPERRRGCSASAARSTAARTSSRRPSSAPGHEQLRDRIEPKQGETWRYRGDAPSPYQQEHEDLIASIAAGKPINEAQAIAESR